MASKLVNIVKGFTLTVLQDGRLVKHRIEAGLQRLEKEIADHWYTIAHSGDVPKGVTKSDDEAAAEDGAAKAEDDAKAAVNSNGGNNRSQTRG